MSFSESINTCLGKYVTFSGRAPRSEYWWFVLAFVIGAMVLAVIDGQIFGYGTPENPGSKPLSIIFNLALFLPVLAVGFRRLQDTGRPGWYLLIPLLVSFAIMFFVFGGIAGFSMMQNAGVSDDALRGPAMFAGMAGLLVAGIVQLVLAVLFIWWLTRPSEPGTNTYGPNPFEGPG